MGFLQDLGGKRLGGAGGGFSHLNFFFWRLFLRRSTLLLFYLFLSVFIIFFSFFFPASMILRNIIRAIAISKRELVLGEMM